MSDLAGVFDNAIPMPGDDASAFVRSQLHTGDAQMSQYDPEAGMREALWWGKLAPGSAAVRALGLYPDGKGWFEPSIEEKVKAGDYGGVATDAFNYLGGRYIKKQAAPMILPRGALWGQPLDDKK